MSTSLPMELGRMEVCLRVADVAASRRFYEGLGFDVIDGKEDEGWLIIECRGTRIGLFTERYMGEDLICMNFRGGNVRVIGETLVAKGYTFSKGPKTGEDGTGSATLKDPDGHTLFFDTASEELMDSPS